MFNQFRQAVEARWYGRPGWLLLLLPLAALYRAVVHVRRQWQLRRQPPLRVPVVVVGNIAVGGTGKTPLLITLVRQLQQAGYAPGVVSRGYGATTDGMPRAVSPDDTSDEVGDEPLLIARTVDCPVVIGRDRPAAAQMLAEQHLCNIVLSDDGLQHYRMHRDLELVVVDASRGFGNGHCLPCGPLREPLGRLHKVDWILRNGNQPCSQLESWSPVPMRLRPQAWVNVQTGERREISDMGWQREPVYAVAGIGNPQRFFITLNELGLTLFPQEFPDHHTFRSEDFRGFADATVIMTAKDAVKCQSFARPSWWYLDVAVELPQSFSKAFLQRVEGLVSAAKPLP